MATPPCARVSSDRLRRGPKLHTSQSRRSAELQGNTCFTGRAASRRQAARRLVGDVRRSATERVGSASRRRRPDIEAGGSELSASPRHDPLLPLELLSDGWHRALHIREQGFVEPAHSRNLQGQTYTDIILPLDVSYEPDIWGQVRRSVEASRSTAQSSFANMQWVRLSLHAELALDYMEARSLDAEEELLQSTVAAYTEALKLRRIAFTAESLPRSTWSRLAHAGNDPGAGHRHRVRTRHL